MSIELHIGSSTEFTAGATGVDSYAHPLLTIAVPTYNRSSHLATFLAALAPQVASEAGIELLISDNASPDGTADLIRNYKARGLAVRYIRNPTNIGGDRNILQCFEEARGKYVWICGDDDVVEPGGLRRLILYLNSKDEYDLIVLEARGFRGSYTPQVPRSPERVKVFTRGEDLARHVHVFFTFISGTIINKARLAAYPHRPFVALADSALVQLSWTYTAVEHHRRSLLIQTPLVATLADNTGGYALFEVFGTNLKRITEEWISRSEVRSAVFRGALLAFFPWFLVKSKDATRFAAEDPDAILRPLFGHYLQYWIFCYPIIKLPPRLGRVWFFLVRVVNKIDKMLGRPLLR